MVALPFTQTEPVEPMFPPIVRYVIIAALAGLLVFGVYFVTRLILNRRQAAVPKPAEIVSAIGVQPRPTSRTLNAFVTFRGDGVHVTNRDRMIWGQCSLEIHSETFEGGDYRYALGTLTPGDTVVVPYSSFRRGNEALGGNGQDAKQQSPQGLAVYCQNLRGKEGWNYFAKQ